METLLVKIIRWTNQPRCKNCNKHIVYKMSGWRHKNGQFVCSMSELDMDYAEPK